MIYHSNMTDREKFNQICDLTTEIVGLQKGDLALNIRKHKYLVPRRVAAVIGKKYQKIHSTIIADIIKVHRTSIIHYMKKHQSDYDTFPLYEETFNKVYAAYDKSEKIKIVFTDKQELAKCLINAGIKICTKEENQQVKIQITSGKQKYILPTNYLEISNNKKIIEKALIGVDYSTKVIIL
tara:strand:+ start:526 stop:1068 length:543 start_codon:yes stop_codon:yes gene_type:complete